LGGDSSISSSSSSSSCSSMSGLVVARPPLLLTDDVVSALERLPFMVDNDGEDWETLSEVDFRFVPRLRRFDCWTCGWEERVGEVETTGMLLERA
jgi:hypothetical protein